MTRADQRSEAAPAAQPERRHLGGGVALALVSSSSTQTGAAIGALAFPAIGPLGVVAVRQLVMTGLLLVLGRARPSRIAGRQWPAVVGLGVAIVLMNGMVYLAVERIGLGLTVTIEFLGPLTVAIATSRRLVDIAGALLAAVGVVVLVSPGPATDALGIGFALIAASAWASYILLSKRVGAELPGLQGAAAASLVSGAIWLPFAVWWFVLHPPVLWAIGLAVLCGLLSSVIPYTADLTALRRIPAALFSTLASLHPVWAVLAGWVILHERFTLNEWIGMALVVTANVAVTATSLRRAPGRGARR